MKTRNLAAVLVLAACLQTVRAGDFGVFGSLWDQREGDRVAGGGAEYLFSFLPLELRGTYYSKATTSEAGDVSALPVDFGVAFGLTRAELFHLYAGGGASYYFLDAEHGDVDNEFGIYGNARLEIPLHKKGLSLFGEALYRSVDVGDLDEDLSGWAFNVGVIFR